MTSGMLSIDQAQINRDTEIFITAMLAQATRAVGDETRGLEKDIETLTKQAAGGQLWRAWKSTVYPRGGKPAYAPRGRVFVNGGSRSLGAMVYFTSTGTNRAKQTHNLAYPTKYAGARGRLRDLSPEQWEAAHGIKLVPVRQGRGEPTLLMARIGSGKAARSVPIFVLIPFQRFANKFSIEPAVERRGKMMLDNLERRMARLNRAGAAALSD